MLADESVADELVLAMLADELAPSASNDQLKPDSEKFSGKNNGSGHCVRTVQCLSTIIISNTTLTVLTVLGARQSTKRIKNAEFE